MNHKPHARKMVSVFGIVLSALLSPGLYGEIVQIDFSGSGYTGYFWSGSYTLAHGIEGMLTYDSDTKFSSISPAGLDGSGMDVTFSGAVQSFRWGTTTIETITHGSIRQLEIGTFNRITFSISFLNSHTGFPAHLTFWVSGNHLFETPLSLAAPPDFSNRISDWPPPLHWDTYMAGPGDNITPAGFNGLLGRVSAGVIPEPSSTLTLLGAASGLLFRRFRR